MSVSKRLKSTPYFGACHATDLPEFFDRCTLQDYLIQFVNGLDPNHGSKLLSWPKYDVKEKKLLLVPEEDSEKPSVCHDTFRMKATALLSKIADAHRT